jgi:hypothetical protein
MLGGADKKREKEGKRKAVRMERKSPWHGFAALVS